MKLPLFPFLLFLLFMLFNTAFTVKTEKNVLVLHSYDQGFEWSDNITAGIMDYFRDKDQIHLDFEYLDARKKYGPDFERYFLELQKYKYRSNWPEAIIVVDNYALDFLKKYGGIIRDRIPVVFCGINNFRPDMMRGFKEITGVTEEISIRENLEMIFRLYPHSKYLYLTTQDTPSEREIYRQILEILSERNKPVTVKLINEKTLEEAIPRIDAIPRESVVIHMANYKNNHGDLLKARISARMALSNCRAPVFGFLDIYLGNGIIGGKLISRYAQGSNAAGMVYRILEGEKASDIPVLTNSPNRYMFDYNQLVRFGIGRNVLPANSQLVNMPVSFIERYRMVIAATFAVLLMAVWLLVLYIIQQRKNRSILIDQKEFQQMLFESIPNPVYYKDLKGRYVGCNHSYEKTYGFTKEKIIGKTVFELFPPEEAELFDAKDRELIRTREQQSFETDITCADGQVRRGISIRSLFYGSKRQPLGIIGVFIDITEQKRMLVELNRAKENAEVMNAELETSRNFLNKIINTISDPVFVKDREHRWVLINDALCEFMGYKREVLLGKSDYDFFPKEQADVFWKNDDIVFQSLFDSVNEEEITDKTGRVHTIITKKSIYIDGQNNLYLVGIISDISERKKLEQELKLMNQNLGERVWEEVNKNREKDLVLIKQSRQAVMGEMIRNIAHQWRQPLNALGIHIQNIREQSRFGNLDETYINRCVEKAVNLVQFMSRTIDDFKDFFKPDKEKTRFSVKESVLRAVSVVEASMKNNFIDMEILLEKDVYANGYPNEYSQVVLNILSNAKDILLEKKATRPRVRLALSEKEGKSELVIWNNGGEIPDPVISRIFEPYFTTKESGTGIGLYMSKMIIEKNMDGKISVRNSDGGAEFKIMVP